MDSTVEVKTITGKIRRCPAITAGRTGANASRIYMACTRAMERLVINPCGESA